MYLSGHIIDGFIVEAKITVIGDERNTKVKVHPEYLRWYIMMKHQVFEEEEKGGLH